MMLFVRDVCKQHFQVYTRLFSFRNTSCAAMYFFFNGVFLEFKKKVNRKKTFQEQFINIYELSFYGKIVIELY